MLLVILMPIARIMMYCVPWYDDFSYGDLTKDLWEMKHSFWDALYGALFTSRTMWYAWQGTYTSCFFMALMSPISIWQTILIKTVLFALRLRVKNKKGF